MRRRWVVPLGVAAALGACSPAGTTPLFRLRSAAGVEVRVLPVDRSGTVRAASSGIEPTSADGGCST